MTFTMKLKVAQFVCATAKYRTNVYPTEKVFGGKEMNKELNERFKPSGGCLAAQRLNAQSLQTLILNTILMRKVSVVTGRSQKFKALRES